MSGRLSAAEISSTTYHEEVLVLRKKYETIQKRLQEIKEEHAETKSRDIDLDKSNTTLVKEYEKIQT